jgi:hypothetical protein
VKTEGLTVAAPKIPLIARKTKYAYWFGMNEMMRFVRPRPRKPYANTGLAE